MSFAFTGVRADGTEVPLPAPASARYDSGEDAPADGFRAEFPLQNSCGALARLRVSGADGGTLFFGTADVQRETVSGTGNILQISCRSLAGLLLDSSPVPQTYEAPSLSVIFERHIRPYGFASFLGGAAVCRGELQIVRGMSEWQTAAEFCRKFLGTAPRVRGTVFDASGAAGNGFLALGTGGTRFFRAEVRRRECDRLTRIYVPDGATGLYRLAAQEDEAAAGVRRLRCLSGAGADASAVLRRADRSAFAVYAECPGMPEAEVGTPASFCDPVLGNYPGMTVSQVRCTWDADGLRTVYCLRRDS